MFADFSKKPRSPLFYIGPSQRIFTDEIEMIPDDHDGARKKQWVEPAGGVGDDQARTPQKLQNPDRQSDFLGRIALVKMKSAGQDQRAAAAKAAGGASVPAGPLASTMTRLGANLIPLDSKAA